MRSQERRARRIEADRADLIAAAERVFARVGYSAAWSSAQTRAMTATYKSSLLSTSL